MLVSKQVFPLGYKDRGTALVSVCPPTGTAFITIAAETLSELSLQPSRSRFELQNALILLCSPTEELALILQSLQDGTETFKHVYGDALCSHV